MEKKSSAKKNSESLVSRLKIRVIEIWRLCENRMGARGTIFGVERTEQLRKNSQLNRRI